MHMSKSCGGGAHCLELVFNSVLGTGTRKKGGEKSCGGPSVVTQRSSRGVGWGEEGEGASDRIRNNAAPILTEVSE